MSKVDTSLPSAERDDLLAEVRHHLPAFLSAATSERPDPAGDVRELLNLTAFDLARVVAVHLALSEPVRRFVAALRHGVRRPLTSTTRPRERTRVVRGSIDWGHTVRLRAATGNVDPIFVLRPAVRVFDTPENRALAWTIDRLLVELSLIGPPDPEQGAAGDNWREEIRGLQQELWRARNVAWLRQVPAERPDAVALRRLLAARVAFYQVDLIDCFEALVRFTENPSPDDITALLAQRYFVPRRDWQLFELVVSLRLAAAFGQVSTKRRKSRLMVGGGRHPFARYELADGSDIRLWYQCWPTSMSDSLHRTIRRHYSIGGSDLRPDIVLERVDGETRTCIVVECKASRSTSYLAEGVAQLLAYLKDRPTGLAPRPNGWLVAPPSDAFKSIDASQLEIWAVTSDEIAAEAVRRLAPLPAAGQGTAAIATPHLSSPG